MGKKRPTVSDRCEIGRQSTGRGGTRRDTKNGFVALGILADAVVRDVTKRRS